jgi:choline-sulfatase
MGCYGDRLNPTPNLDRLAGEGVRFDAAYTTCPVCSPARLSFVAGQYVSNCGAWNNQCMLPSDEHPSVAHLLNTAGYESWLCGKMHFERSRRYGFREVFPHHGNSKGKSGEIDPSALPDRAPNREQWRRRSASFRTVPDNQPFRADPRVSECDAFITDEAIRFLRQQGRSSSEPFFLTVGYHAPHFPLHVPQHWYDRFAGRVPPPVDPHGREAMKIPHYRARNAIHGVVPEEISDEETMRGRTCYWALTAWLDNEIGKLLNEIERLGMAEDTVIVYTSDHGENKGDHGMWWKLCMYESAVRVPLIVRWPSRLPGGQNRSGCCSLVDLSATLLEIAGVQRPSDWDGASLLPYLSDPDTPWRDYALSQIFGGGTAGSVMLRRNRFKYVYHTPYPGEESSLELYDMENDPDELENLAVRPECAEVIGDLHCQMAAIMGRTPEAIEKTLREWSEKSSP